FGSATRLRVALDRTKHGKRCEGAPHSKSPEIAGRNPIMIRVNWRDSRAKNLRKTRRFWPIAVQITRIKSGEHTRPCACWRLRKLSRVANFRMSKVRRRETQRPMNSATDQHR